MRKGDVATVAAAGGREGGKGYLIIQKSHIMPHVNNWLFIESRTKKYFKSFEKAFVVHIEQCLLTVLWTRAFNGLQGRLLKAYRMDTLYKVNSCKCSAYYGSTKPS